MLRKLLRKTPLAWLQLTREKTRLVTALAGIAFADILMFFQLGLNDSLYDAAVAPYDALQGDLFIISNKYDNLQLTQNFARERLYQAVGVKGVKSVDYLYIDRAQWRNPQTGASRNVSVFGIAPTQIALKLPEVNQHLSELKLLNRVLYDRQGVAQLGDVVSLLQQQRSLSVQINDLEMKVIGVFGLGAGFAADGNLIASHSTFLRLFPERQPNRIDLGLLRLQPDAKLQQVQANLRASLPKDVLVLTLEELAERERAYWSSGGTLSFIFGFGAVIGFFVGTAIVYQILYTDVSDHLPEYATLKAMGYSNSYLIGILAQESMILALLGFIPGVAISMGLYWIAHAVTLLPIGMKFSRALLWCWV
jgi:putative ABC transport system permease protein